MRLVLYTGQSPLLLASAALAILSAAKVGQAMYCASENEEWVGCLNDAVGSQGAQKCFDCVELSYLALSQYTTCDAVTQKHCSWQNACSLDCGQCDGLYEAYLACFWGSDCFTGCSGERPTSTARICAKV